MLVLKHLSKTYSGGTSPAVDDLSLEIHEGEVFTILGPSGCGKTTTLRMVAGLEVPDEGSIYFRDRPIVESAKRIMVPPNQRNVGMVFQSYAIWPHMTVAENVAYPLKVRHLPQMEVRRRVALALHLVGLTGLEHRPAPQLSGGQQQRVALARALVYEPEVFLLDEPFSNLDTKLREQMRLELKLLQSRLQATVLFVTHDQVEALSLSDRIAVMDRGRVLHVGPPRELYNQPSDAFVRDFLGRTVLVRGTVHAHGPGDTVAVSIEGAPGCVVHGKSRLGEPMNPGADVQVAFRPENVEIARPASLTAQQNAIPGVIETTLFTGDRTEYRVRLREQDPILIYGNRSEAFRGGDEILVRLRPDDVSVWDS